MLQILLFLILLFYLASCNPTRHITQVQKIPISIPELQNDNFEIDIAFMVERDTNGTIIITPTLSNDVNIDFDRTVEHNLKLVFRLKDVK